MRFEPDIEEECLPGFIPGSWDTEDKYLKTIRRGMEEATRGISIKKYAKKHGYELPCHWLFDNHDEEQAIEWPQGTEDDIAGAMIDSTGKQPMVVSDPPDPKKFSSFEEYKQALEIRDTFLDHVEIVNSILTYGKNQEEIDKAMEAIGYQKHDDAPCNRPWCIERYGCVAMTLMNVLRDIEEFFFDHSLATENRLLSDKDFERCELLDCHALPLKWFEAGIQEHEVFRWFVNLMDVLVWNERKVPFASLAEDPLECAFVREVYLFTLSVLRKRPWSHEQEGKDLIAGFLADNDLLQAEDAANFLKNFKRCYLKAGRKLAKRQKTVS